MDMVLVDMTAQEARDCVNQISAHIQSARALIYSLYDRNGWKALGYKSWRDCVIAEFQHSQTHMYRHLKAAQVEVNVGISPIGELRESYARELAPLEPEAQRIVYQAMKETAPDGKVTAGHIRSVANVMKEILTTGAIDDGTGNSIPVNQATSEHLKAAVIEETYERMQRQRMHIAEKSERPAIVIYGQPGNVLRARFADGSMIQCDPDTLINLIQRWAKRQ